MEGRSEFVPSKGAKGQCRRIFKFHGDVLTNQFVLLSIQIDIEAGLIALAVQDGIGDLSILSDGKARDDWPDLCCWVAS